MRRPLIFAVALPAILIAPAALHAQQQPAADKPALTLKVQAREVILPVTVRDKKGAVVSNLKAADFTLTEDGRPQTIKSFQQDSNLPFRIGLLCDTSQSMSSSLEAERKAAGKFVDAMLPTGPANSRKDQAFLIHFDRQVELLEDFTISPEKLHRELDEMGPSRRAANNDDQGAPDNNGNANNNDGGYGQGRGGRGQGEGRMRSHGGTQLYDAIFLASDEMMKPQNGRKALVLFADGVDRASKETLSDALDAAEHNNVVIYAIYFKGEESPAGGGWGGNQRRGGMGGGWPGGGGGWPGGGRGGGNGGSQDKPAVDGKKIMEKIAQRTGGRYFEAKKKDNLEEIYNQIAEDLRAQCLLTYTPDLVDKDGGYHKVEIKAAKGDWQIFTRPGYYAQEEK
jgi:VWFA-related protein